MPKSQKNEQNGILLSYVKYVVVVDPFLYIFVFCNNVTIITKPPGFVIL